MQGCACGRRLGGAVLAPTAQGSWRGQAATGRARLQARMEEAASLEWPASDPAVHRRRLGAGPLLSHHSHRRRAGDSPRSLPVCAEPEVAMARSPEPCSCPRPRPLPGCHSLGSCEQTRVGDSGTRRWLPPVKSSRNLEGV